MMASGVTIQPIGIGHPAIALWTMPALRMALQRRATIVGMPRKECTRLFWASGVTIQPIGIGHPAIALWTMPALRMALQRRATIVGMPRKECTRLFWAGNSTTSNVDLSEGNGLASGGGSCSRHGDAIIK